MFKLTIVGGPAQGQSFEVKDGENTIGRVAGNDIVLSSVKVSKRHCVLVVDNTGVLVKDAGSSNGTFVNGVLTKIKKLVPGDRISIGEFVVELTKIVKTSNTKQNNVVALNFPGGLELTAPPENPTFNQGAGLDNSLSESPSKLKEEPKDVKEKIQFLFEKYILNFLYNLNERQEWRNILAGIIGVTTLLGSFASVYPILERLREKLTNEAAGRALLLARQIVERNSVYIYERTESKSDVSFVEKEPGVIAAYLIDLDGRVLAPARKSNQYLTESQEAAFSAFSRNKFSTSEVLEKVVRDFGNTMAVAVPLRVFHNEYKKNVVAASGLVFFDKSHILLDSGTEGLIYIQAFILCAIIGVVAYFSVYRLTLNPLQHINDNIDAVLKGSQGSVSSKFKVSELTPLVDIINAALQRTGGGSGDVFGAQTSASNVEEVLALVKNLYGSSKESGVLVFSADRKIVFVNNTMEDISGIRNDNAVGSTIDAVARDAAMVAFVEDALNKASSSPDVIKEDFEFSGITYAMETICTGVQSGKPQIFVLKASKNT